MPAVLAATMSSLYKAEGQKIVSFQGETCYSMTMCLTAGKFFGLFRWENFNNCPPWSSDVIALTRAGCDTAPVPALESNVVVVEIGVSRIITGPESDHWQCLSVTDSLTDGRFVNLIDVTLARVDDNSKCVKAVLLLLWMIRIVSTTVWSRQGQ